MLIFHYASLETFKSIIENHCIWLCDIQKSNDSTERTYFEQMLLEIYVEKALLAFKSTYYSQRPDIPPIYSASFSLDGDLLGQWRAYAAFPPASRMRCALPRTAPWRPPSGLPCAARRASACGRFRCSGTARRRPRPSPRRFRKSRADGGR